MDDVNVFLPDPASCSVSTPKLGGAPQTEHRKHLSWFSGSLNHYSQMMNFIFVNAYELWLLTDSKNNISCPLSQHMYAVLFFFIVFILSI